MQENCNPFGGEAWNFFGLLNFPPAHLYVYFMVPNCNEGKVHTVLQKQFTIIF